MTEFQNRRQHWVSFFSAGVTNVQHVASLSLRFILKKLINSALRLNVAPVAPKHSIPTLKKQKIKACYIASFAFVLRPPSLGRPQRRKRARPAPLFWKTKEVLILKKQPKTEIISTRVTPEQREIIEEKAYSSYRTPSMYLRDCALGKKIIVVKGVDEVRCALGRRA